MPQFLVASYLPDDFDPSVLTEETIAAIHALNDEMEAAGVLKFACGVSPASSAKTLRKQSDGRVSFTDGPFTETKEHIGGILLLETANLDEALAWVRKGAANFLAPIEVRQIFFQADPKRPAEKPGHGDF
ncbi:MAG TPA: YciI family protein [Candidatus Eisenbacteria bacterium]|nr:YciI family protein [Candidatus Eisenbacteria bacterium]